MKFKDLEIFQAVARHGTMAAAARELNYVQSNLTARIHNLEEELDTLLFNRHHRGMSLTPEGKKLLTYSEKILALTEEMMQAVRNPTEPSGKLEIGTVETVIQLPKILSSYINHYQRVELSVYTGVTETLKNDVLNHRLDGAFVIESDPHPELVSYQVFQEELVLISDPATETLAAVKEKPFLCFGKGCGYRARLEAWYQDQQITPKRVMEFGTLETILQSVTIGLGVTFVPRSAVTHLEQNGLIRCHSLPKEYSTINTLFIRRADLNLTPTIEKFIETIIEYGDGSPDSEADSGSRPAF